MALAGKGPETAISEVLKAGDKKFNADRNALKFHYIYIA
jgi:hypothetical protein